MTVSMYVSSLKNRYRYYFHNFNFKRVLGQNQILLNLIFEPNCVYRSICCISTRPKSAHPTVLRLLFGTRHFPVRP